MLQKTSEDATASRTEALILFEALQPAIKMIQQYMDMGVGPIILNFCVDWGCVTAMRHLCGVLCALRPEIPFRIVRCNVHSWGNWVSDSTKRVIGMLKPPTLTWSLSRLSDLVYWEVRTLLHNRTHVDEIAKEYCSQLPIDLIPASEGSNEPPIREKTFYSFLLHVIDVIGIGKGRSKFEHSQLELRYERVKKLAKVFYWVAGENPKRITTDMGRAPDEAARREEMRVLILAVMGLVVEGNFARWLSMGPAVTALLLMRWVLPDAAQAVFRKCKRKSEEGVEQTHIGGGEYVEVTQLARASEMKLYLSSMMTVAMMTRPGDAATKASRRTSNGVRVHSNEKVNDVWQSEFDNAAKSVVKSAKNVVFLGCQMSMKWSWEELNNIISSWNIGFASMWGQYSIQMGHARIKSYLPRAITILQDVINGSRPATEALTALRGLHEGDVRKEQELGDLSLTWGIVNDVERTIGDGPTALMGIVQRWCDALECARLQGLENAYEVLFFLGGGGGFGAVGR